MKIIITLLFLLITSNKVLAADYTTLIKNRDFRIQSNSKVRNVSMKPHWYKSNIGNNKYQYRSPISEPFSYQLDVGYAASGEIKELFEYAHKSSDPDLPFRENISFTTFDQDGKLSMHTRCKVPTLFNHSHHCETVSPASCQKILDNHNVAEFNQVFAKLRKCEDLERDITEVRNSTRDKKNYAAHRSNLQKRISSVPIVGDRTETPEIKNSSPAFHNILSACERIVPYIDKSALSPNVRSPHSRPNDSNSRHSD